MDYVLPLSMLSFLAPVHLAISKQDKCMACLVFYSMLASMAFHWVDDNDPGIGSMDEVLFNHHSAQFLDLVACFMVVGSVSDMYWTRRLVYDLKNNLNGVAVWTLCAVSILSLNFTSETMRSAGHIVIYVWTHMLWHVMAAGLLYFTLYKIYNFKEA